MTHSSYTPEIASALRDVPHSVIGGVVYFHKAAHRDLAAIKCKLPEFPKRDPLYSGRARGVMTKQHLIGSKCYHRKFRIRGPVAQGRYLDRASFGRTCLKDRCVDCQYWFRNNKG